LIEQYPGSDLGTPAVGKNTNMSGAKPDRPEPTSLIIIPKRERKWAVVNAVISPTENISKVVGD
jgi:hypothetical protein